MQQLFKLLWVMVHIAHGLVIISFVFPRISMGTRKQHIQRWSQKLSRIAGIRVLAFGEPLVARADQPVLLLANHVSWFDIFALDAIAPVRFVAKSEVAHWPIIGRLCSGTGTLFVNRTQARDTLRVNNEISQTLRSGDLVGIFPEGTTTDGGQMLPFRSSLLQPAMDTQAAVQPVYLRYVDAHGRRDITAAYHDDTTFGESLWRILGSKGITIELHYLPAVPIGECSTRQQLASTVEQRVSARQTALLASEGRIPAHQPTPRASRDFTIESSEDLVWLSLKV